MGHVFDGGEVGRGVIGSHPALVIAEDVNAGEKMHQRAGAKMHR